MRTNTVHHTPAGHTFNGGPAVHISKEQELRKAVLCCLLWEKEFYQQGHETANRIYSLAQELPFETVAGLAVEAREKYKLRHVPLHLLCALIDAGHKGSKMGQLIADVIQRPDEMAELLSLYWKNKRRPLTKQLKRGLAGAFGKFSEYQLAKFNRPGNVALRDVMFLAHVNPLYCPQNLREREELQKRVANKALVTPDTWETQLSSGANKHDTWVRLIGERKLGPQALLKNLRNMTEAGVHADVIRVAIKNMKTERVLPFEFLTAARHAKQFEPELEQKMFECLDKGSLKGTTTLLIDSSGSMDDKISQKSELTRHDCAKALAMLLREECEQVRIFTFASDPKPREVAPRRGFALADAIGRTYGGTLLGQSIDWVNKNAPSDRLIVITDEQSGDRVGGPGKKGYMLNVATYEKSVGYGPWVRVSGWSEAVVDFIKEVEAL